MATDRHPDLTAREAVAGSTLAEIRAVDIDDVLDYVHADLERLPALLPRRRRAAGGEPAAATYVLGAPLDDWQELLDGADAGRLVVYRRIRLERGDVLAFFRMIYFVVESLAALGRVPARRAIRALEPHSGLGPW
jgi:hypothetical protein